MYRFFVPAECIRNEAVVIRGGPAHQIRDVLRLKAGDRVAVLDDSGCEYEVTLDQVSRGTASGRICSKRDIAEPGTEVVLYQSLLKGTRFEFVLQKCTEVGVCGFVPVACERSLARYPGDKKMERWRRIITEASEQSGRGKLPRLQPAVSFRQACQSVQGPSLIACVGGVATGLRSILRSRPLTADRGDYAKVNLFIGPEGGFSPSELEFASTCGVSAVGLGNRVLRAETAGLVAAAAILYESGDLEPGPPLGNGEA